MKNSPPSVDHVQRLIHLVRGHKVMLDRDLAQLYNVSIKALNQAVKRNIERFPIDFMFQLSREEAKSLRSQNVTLNKKRGQHRKYIPHAFTEQGLAMLSSVLRSPRAIQVNIAIMRTFVQFRQMLSQNSELTKRLDDLEKKYTSQFRVVFQAIRELMEGPAKLPRVKGFSP